METNPVGKNTKTIGVNLRKEIADEVERRARGMYFNTSNYMKILLMQHIESGEKLVLKEGA